MIFHNIPDDIHTEVTQIKRFEKGSGKSVKMLSFDSDNQCAEFEGSDGSIYNTSLDGCSCIDYSFHNLPCKHMYKLAIECGLIDVTSEPWKTYTCYSKLLNKVKKKLNDLDIEQLETLSKFIEKL